MKQFLLPFCPEKGALVNLSGRDYHYLVNVRRLKKGARFPALLPDGNRITLSVVNIERKNKICLCAACDPGGLEADTASGNLPGMALFQVIPKASKFDLIIRQTCECGVSKIVPFTSEHSVKLFKDKKNAAARLERWQRIIREARQQSNSPVDTAISEVLDFNGALDLLASFKNALPLVFLSPSEMPQTEAPSSLHSILKKDADLYAFFVGAEGGFSKNEVKEFLEAGVRPVSLGGNVLRAETAAIAAVSAVKLLYLERECWV